MSTNPPGTITKLDQRWPKDLKNLKSQSFGLVDIPDTPVPFDPGTDHNPLPPEALGKNDLWQQLLTQLKDVPTPQSGDTGKSLIVRLFQASEGNLTYYQFSWEEPSVLLVPRDFSITGDGTAPVVGFDGSADVVLTITNEQAAKWTTARQLLLSGDVTGDVTFDGSSNITLDITVNHATHADTATTATTAGHATTADTATTATTAVTATNAGHATTADTAMHATTADSATTAGGLSGGDSLTVTLVGDVTGTGTGSLEGTIEISTTVATSGTGGQSGSLVLGATKQCWGRVTGAGGAAITLPATGLVIPFNFPSGIAFTSGDSYSFIPAFENVGGTGQLVWAITSRDTTSVTLSLSSDNDELAAVNFIAAGT